MAQMQPLPEEQPDQVAVAAKKTYAALMAYNLDIKQAEQALAAQGKFERPATLSIRG